VNEEKKSKEKEGDVVKDDIIQDYDSVLKESGVLILYCFPFKAYSWVFSFFDCSYLTDIIVEPINCKICEPLSIQKYYASK